MPSHRNIRINLNMPELTPSQAESLWNFLEDLASALWEEYESELLDCQDQDAHVSEDSCADGHRDATADHYRAPDPIKL